MAKYPTSKNIPTLLVDNVAQRYEIKDTTNYTSGGLWDQNTTRFTNVTVRLATAGALAAATYSNSAGTITASGNGALSVDGVVTVNNDLILVKNYTTTSATQNGIYKVTDTGSAGTPFILTRYAPMDTNGSLVANRYTATPSAGTLAGNVYYLTLSNPSTTAPFYALGSCYLTFSTTAPTSGALSTVADTVLSFNNLITDLDALSAILPGISQASGSRAYTASTNAGFTALEQKFSAQEYSRNLRRAQAHAQLVSKLIVNLTSQLTAISTATQPAVNRYPSAKNRDGF